MKKFEFLLFLFFIYFKRLKGYVVYNLKTLEEGTNNIESLLSFNSTYTILEIGTPPQQVNFFFDLTHHQINLTDKGCSNKNLYNKNNSTSFKIAFELDLPQQDNNTKYLVLDSLYFYTDLNITKKLKVPEYPLYYSSDISRNDTDLCGNIGLRIFQFETYNFDPPNIKYYTDEIKKLGAGKYEDFSFFHYNNQDLLINDIFLQTEFPELFKGIEHVVWFYPSYRVSTMELYWEFYMDDIYYKNVHLKSTRIELNPLFELIVGTNNYKKNITNDFFNNYIEKGICTIKEYKGFHVIECDQAKFKKKDINKCPGIYFSNVKASHIFELDSEELFININNKWYFKIVFPIEDLDTERWILGRIFMRKYPVKFAPFSSMIGFYIIPNEGNTNKEDKKDNKKGNNSKTVVYIIIIVIALIFTAVGLFLGKQIFYPRKKRANELLDDNYEYESNNKEELNNKKNKIISDSPINE